MLFSHLVLGTPTIKLNVEAGMEMAGNGNELSGAIREWEWFFKCVNFGNGNGKDLAGMGGIGNTENHSRTSLIGDLFGETPAKPCKPGNRVQLLLVLTRSYRHCVWPIVLYLLCYSVYVYDS